MKVEGGCHCGAIVYEAEVDPEHVIICHCTDCQNLSGSAYRTVAFVSEADFHWVTGEPKIYVKTAESGNKREQAFCSDCGSPFYATSVGPGPRTLGLRVGSIKQRAQLPPRSQKYCRSALDWVQDLSALPKS